MYVLRIMFVDPRSYAVVDGSGRHLVVTDHKWAIHDLDAVVRRNEDILPRERQCGGCIQAISYEGISEVLPEKLEMLELLIKLFQKVWRTI